MELCERLHYTLTDFRNSVSAAEVKLWAIRDTLRSEAEEKYKRRAELDAEVQRDFEKNRGKFTRFGRR